MNTLHWTMLWYLAGLLGFIKIVLLDYSNVVNSTVMDKVFRDTTTPTLYEVMAYSLIGPFALGLAIYFTHLDNKDKEIQ